MSASASTTTGSKNLQAFLAAEGFESDLEQELKIEGFDIEERYERLFVARGPELPQPPAWSQNSWLDLHSINIKSISDGAKQLRSLGRQWALYSVEHHRRAHLVQEQLPKRKERVWEFLEPRPETPLGSWTLVEPNRILASARCSSPFANGEIRFNEESSSAPSRAYLKLWDLFTSHGFAPKKGERCVDLGSSPGGWTWVLQSLGTSVLSVDGAPLDPKVATLPGVEYRKGDAFKIEPATLGEVDWVFCDVIAYPAKTLELIRQWMDRRPAVKLVFTIKFQGDTDFEVIRALKRIPGSRLVHLFHNKHELTWFKRA